MEGFTHFYTTTTNVVSSNTIKKKLGNFINSKPYSQYKEKGCRYVYLYTNVKCLYREEFQNNSKCMNMSEVIFSWGKIIC